MSKINKNKSINFSKRDAPVVSEFKTFMWMHHTRGVQDTIYIKMVPWYIIYKFPTFCRKISFLTHYSDTYFFLLQKWMCVCSDFTADVYGQYCKIVWKHAQKSTHYDWWTEGLLSIGFLISFLKMLWTHFSLGTPK